MLSAISFVTLKQGDLLELETNSNANLIWALDNLNQRYGRVTVKVSTQGSSNGWQMRQEHKSPNYTTCRSEVPIV